MRVPYSYNTHTVIYTDKQTTRSHILNKDVVYRYESDDTMLTLRVNGLNTLKSS